MGRRTSRGNKKRNALWIYIVLLILAVGAMLTVFMWPEHSPEPIEPEEKKVIVDILMYGDANVILEYGSTYEDAGANGVWYYQQEPQTKHSASVEAVGEVDVSKVGVYTITYTAQYEDVSVEKIRTVHVVDTQKPVIELVSDPDNYTVSGEKYQEEGFTAKDNYDGDITDKVQRIESEDGKTVTYRVSDSSGNQTEVVRQIKYGDVDAPVLTLKGKEQVTITAGQEWKEPGYTAIDAVDGDLTKNVTISGSVNHRIAGNYVLTYSVSDRFGNKASVKRTITVKAVPKPEVVEPDGNGKVIYLTFDDGPGKHTERLLQILDKYDVKATFFVCNTGYLHLLDDIAAGGHTIGIHSKSHKYSSIYASEDAFFADFNAMRDIIVQYTGVEPTVTRFPGGSSNHVSKKHCEGIMTRLVRAVQDLGYQYFDWNIDSNDAGGTKTAEGVYNNVTQRIAKSKSKSLVVLQHDTNGYSVDAVEQIIIWGLEHGYTFAPLTTSSPVCHHSLNN